MSDTTVFRTLLLPVHAGPVNSHACVGTTVADIEEDVGLSVGVCPVCRRTFVYRTDAGQWFDEQVFEKMIADAGPVLGSAMRGL